MFSPAEAKGKTTLHKRLEPKLLSVLREGYTKQQLRADIVAGVIVGIVALPLAIAFGCDRRGQATTISHFTHSTMRLRSFHFPLIFAVLLLTPLLHAIAQPNPKVTDAYETQIQTWHDRRVASLTRPVGWLSLIALDWLNEGRNTAQLFGTVTLRNDTLFFEAFPDAKVTMQGAPFASGVILAERDRIEAGSRVFTVIKRGGRYALRIWDRNAETLRNFKGIQRFPVLRRWRLEARWRPYASPKPVKVPSIIPGMVEDANIPGVAEFTIDGKEYRLEPLESGPNGLFFVFADATNGRETYGAGRFLYTDPPAGDTLIIDFNRAQNPPCAFTNYATCPLPTESNRLPVRIEAGELRYGEH